MSDKARPFQRPLITDHRKAKASQDSPELGGGITDNLVRECRPYTATPQSANILGKSRRGQSGVRRKGRLCPLCGHRAEEIVAPRTNGSNAKAAPQQCAASPTAAVGRFHSARQRQLGLAPLPSAWRAQRLCSASPSSSHIQPKSYSARGVPC
jgi:hypothetical protein